MHQYSQERQQYWDVFCNELDQRAKAGETILIGSDEEMDEDFDRWLEKRWKASQEAPSLVSQLETLRDHAQLVLNGVDKATDWRHWQIAYDLNHALGCIATAIDFAKLPATAPEEVTLSVPQP